MTFFPDCSFGLPVRLLAAAALGCAVSAGPLLAQTDPDPVLASVNGQPIHLSDVKEATAGLPPQARSMPPQQLYPMLLEQLIDARALLIQAQRTGLDKDPEVQKSMQAAQDHALESALLA
jgi:peptidyl-prolyl cis-trans isomerase C